MAVGTRIFIGSSSESQPVMEAVTAQLADYEVVPWSADVFQPGTFTVDSLLQEVNRADFAVFVFALDDIALIREKVYSATRDNVIFELGLFMAKLGRRRCFFMVPRGAGDFRIPSDLHGITHLTYDAGRVNREPKAAVAPAVGDLKQAIRRLTFGDGTVSSLSGRWNQAWNVESTSYAERNESIAEVRQIGTEFKAEFEAEGRMYIMDGEIQRGDIVTGRWYDREQGATYFGAFQLKIHPKHKHMRGKWLGFTDGGNIRCDAWEWARLDE
jgi:hypothetical protein